MTANPSIYSFQERIQGYEQAMRDAGGVDVQLLGLGRNGHIGFNEPTSSFASRTRMKTLAPRTRASDDPRSRQDRWIDLADQGIILLDPDAAR